MVSLAPSQDRRPIAADLRVHVIAFGGRAIEPLSDAGRDFVAALLGDLGEDAVFSAADACMAGFPDNAVGVEPRDFDGAFDAALDAFLIVVDAHDRPIGRQADRA